MKLKWLKQLSLAIQYIEDNLTKDISYDEAAKIACCSNIIFSACFPTLQVYLYQNIYAEGA
ncbi:MULTISPECIES: hypothetical protein [Clostridium]|uniref:hypothetical protein n=1 Tax=Clostridium TaxID=1485 RepID=UPI000ACC9741